MHGKDSWLLGAYVHGHMVWDALKSAKRDKTSLSAIWLDVANAYGSVPHRLIYFALKRYGVSEKWIKIIQQYYGGIWSKCFQEFSPSSWHHHQRVIFIGCTVSIILFLAAINVITEFTLSLQDSFIQEHRLGMKVFMDDLFVTSSSTKGTQLLLNRCTQVLTWAGTSFRAETITCVKLTVGPITHVESYGQVHKSCRTGSCLPFGNCKCYYLYLVKCLFLFLFVCSVVALVLSLFCPEGYPV